MIICALLNAANWINDLLFGPMATSVAVIAVAWFGFSMLWGRINLRRGLSVILGCFLLFGARMIGEGLSTIRRNDNLQPVAISPPAPSYTVTPPPTHQPNAFDPYAGTAILPSEQ